MVPTQYLEDQFALIDSVPTPIFILDVPNDGIPVYAYCNQNLLRRLGRNLSDFVGKTAVQAFGVELGAKLYHEQCKTIASRQQQIFEFHYQIDDRQLNARTTLTPQIDQTQRVVRLVGSSEDISNEKIALKTQAKLNEIGNEVEQFIAMAAHDLRTPMRNVMDLAELLYDDFEDHGDGKLELISLLKETAEKSMDLISDVLSYASTLGPETPSSTYNLEKLCQDLMMILDPKRQHKLLCTDVKLTGEKCVMQIALRNLIDNALKHGGRISMTLTCTAELTNPDTVEVTLIDDGAGFENPGIAFLETGKFRMESGYGLLAVRKLITARGGEITAANDSQTGGSRVKFSLPNATGTMKQDLSTFQPPPK